MNISASTNWLVSDFEFTNTTSYSDIKYLHAYTNDYKDYEIRYVLQVYRDWGLNPVLFFVTAWREGRPVDNYHLGCNSHYEIPRGIDKHKNFYSQVSCSAWTYKYWFTNAPYEHYKCFLYDNEKLHKVSNKATYSIYMYCPRYWHFTYGDYHGNKTFPIIWRKVKRKLEEQ